MRGEEWVWLGMGCKIKGRGWWRRCVAMEARCVRLCCSIRWTDGGGGGLLAGSWWLWCGFII